MLHWNSQLMLAFTLINDCILFHSRFAPTRLINWFHRIRQHKSSVSKNVQIIFEPGLVALGNVLQNHPLLYRNYTSEPVDWNLHVKSVCTCKCVMSRERVCVCAKWGVCVGYYGCAILGVCVLCVCAMSPECVCVQYMLCQEHVCGWNVTCVCVWYEWDGQLGREKRPTVLSSLWVIRRKGGKPVETQSAWAALHHSFPIQHSSTAFISRG